MGVATVEIANVCPDTDFLAIDVHGPGVGNILKLIEEEYVTGWQKERRKKNIIILNTDDKLEESDSTTMTAKPMLWGNLLGSQKVSVT